MQKTILIISTLDTKGEETFYIKEKIEKIGSNTLLMDVSMRGREPSKGDIAPEQVASAAGSSIERFTVPRIG